MIKKDYKWKRFWYEQNNSHNFLTEEGFLINPEGDCCHEYKDKLKTLDELLTYPCLILLGEPGMGKTNIIRNFQKTMLDEKKINPSDLVFLELGYSDINRELIDNPTIHSWIDGSNNLFLILDALDEGILLTPNLSKILIREFKKYPIDRLKLVISCRSNVWPKIFEQGLKEIWSTKLGIFQLAPLRCIDIENAVIENEIDKDEFIEEIKNLAVVPFAVNPITLKFLISIYKENKRFPVGQIELYQRGCENLCQESEERLEIGLKGKLSTSKRIAVASRIAALTIFTEKSIIYNGNEYLNTPNHYINIKEMIGGFENVKGNSLEIFEEEINEVLTTGLFIACGPNCFKWTHQTYAEFLAATYLTNSGIVIEQIQSLLIHPVEKKVFPQLHQVAAWLAGMRQDVFDVILKNDPNVLLLGDFSSVTNLSKANLVQALFDHFDDNNNFSRYLSLSILSKLNHPDLISQIEPYIKEDFFLADHYKEIFIRRFAVLIVIACQIVELLDDLLVLALKVYHSDSVIMDYVTYAINRFGSDELRLKLEQNKPVEQINPYFYTEKIVNVPNNNNTKDNYKIAEEKVDIDKFRESLNTYINQFESGNSKIWSQIFDLFKNNFNPFWNYNLENSNEWKYLCTNERDNIIKIAKRYIMEYELYDINWWVDVFENSIFNEGICAIRTIYSYEQDFLLNMPHSIWEKWAPLIIEYPYLHFFDDDLHDELIKIVSTKVPNEIIKILINRVKSCNEDKYSLERLFDDINFWNNSMADALYKIVESSALKPEIMAIILAKLLEHNYIPGKIFAESLVRKAWNSNNRKKSLLASYVACALFLYTDDMGYFTIWPIIEKDNRFGKDMFLALYNLSMSSRDFGFYDHLKIMNTEYIKELFGWLYEFSLTADKNFKFKDIKRKAREWLDDIIYKLKDSGLTSSFIAIKELAIRYPDIKNIQLKPKNIWIQILPQYLSMTWKPSQPNDILKLVQSSQNRLIHSEEHLFEVVIESLRRFEIKLHGETPWVVFLWNESVKDKLKPVSENKLSDLIKIHLTEDLVKRGIIVNRELSIRPTIGKKPGERTDIHIDASIFNNNTKQYEDIVSVIIEVKGCWNKSLNTAMKTQLVERYLRNNRCKHGIYLIGWYYCPEWKINKLNIEQAQLMFDRQAEELSVNGITVKAIILNTACSDIGSG